MIEQALVTVYRSQGILGAEVVKGRLETAGIPALLKYESLGQVFGLIVDGLGLVEVQVSQEQEEAALELLAEVSEMDEFEAEDAAEPDEM